MFERDGSELIVEFSLFDDAAARARLYYSRAKQAPSAGVHSASELPAREILDFGIVGSLRIASGARSVFVPDAPGATPSDMPVLLCLLGLRLATTRASAGQPQAVPYGPDWGTIRVEEQHGMLCVSTNDEHKVCQPIATWMPKLDAALLTLRTWIISELPELQDDPVLGDWVRGAPPPELTALTDPADAGVGF